MPQNNNNNQKKSLFNFKKFNKETAKKTAYKLAVSYQRSENAAAVDHSVSAAALAYNALGQFLYRVGFQTEYFGICFKRAIKEFGVNFVSTSKKLLRKASLFAKKSAKILLIDFLEPWQRIMQVFGQVKAEIDKEYQKNGTRNVAKASFGYFFATIKALLHLLSSLSGYLLPISACLVFVYAISTMQNLEFGLQVKIEGNMLGYVENESVYEQAQALVRERIRSTKEGQEWKVAPSFSISSVKSKNFVDSTQLADKMVEASSDEIQNAMGIIIDGELIGVTTNSEALTQTLESIKAPFQDPENPNLSVEFVRDVQLQPGIYYTSSLTDAQPIIETLTGQVSGRQTYIVVKGDSPSGIAKKIGLPLKDLYALNPHIDPSVTNKVKMGVGDELLISNAVDYLQVKTVERVTRQLSIEHQVVKTNSQELEWGRQKVVAEGADGLEERVVDVTRIGGIVTNEEIISSVVLQEPVTEEVIIGVKLANGGIAGDASTGNMIWPVPNSRSMSRGWSSGHRALDIRAPRGTPIVAADNGIVQFGGRGSGSYWSYGNYVQIQHSNGIITLYAHMNAVAVGSGQYVNKGQVIGYVGSTGRSTGNHLHFETIVGGSRVDPFRYVKR